MLPGQSFTPNAIVSILKRRRWAIMLPFALGLAAVPLVAKWVPRVYRSETLIMVIPQRVPENYVRPTVTATVEDRLPLISDQILSRSRLERIIEDFKLYQDRRGNVPMEDIVRGMRLDVGPISIREKERSFRVGYTSTDAPTAQKVAARLASLFLEENSRDRENRADSTNVFLESQLEEAKQRLMAHEKRLTEFQQMYAGELPTQLEGNLRSMQALQLQLQSVSDSLNRARERQMLTQRQLIDAQTLPLSVTPPLGTPATGEAQTALPAAQQLEALQARLEAYKLKYTPDHPEMKSVERAIAKVKLQVAEEEKRPAPEKAQTPAEQARQKQIRNFQADMEVIDRQLAVGQAEESKLKAQIADYQRKIEAVPGRDSQLVELSRDYDTLKKTYDSLLTRREDSKLAANLERRQIGEQFRILDPASLPVRPSNRVQRLGLSFSGAILGLAIGLALAALREYKDTSFSREEDVARILTLPVLALVPIMISQQERKRSRMRRLLMDVAGTVVLASSATVVVMWGLAQL